MTHDPISSVGSALSNLDKVQAEQAWTPEPWKCDLTDFGSLPFSSYVGVDSEGGVSVAYVLTCDRAREKSIPEWKANARRIVAAVNATAGISTAALEQSVVAKMREALEPLAQNADFYKPELPHYHYVEIPLQLLRVARHAYQLASGDLALSRSEPENRGTV